MGADEWPLWVALDQLSPIGPDTERFLLAQLLTVMVNSNRDPKKSRPIDVGDVLPYLGTRHATLQQIDVGNIRIDPRIKALRARAQDSD